MEKSTPQEDLTQPGVVETLIQDGRIPGWFSKAGDKTAIFVPPKGTQLGDTVEGTPGLGLSFSSPEGKYRGSAEIVVVSDEEASSIEKRIEAVLGKE